MFHVMGSLYVWQFHYLFNRDNICECDLIQTFRSVYVVAQLHNLIVYLYSYGFLRYVLCKIYKPIIKYYL